MTIPDLVGATQPGPDHSWPADPGEYAARWNRATQEERAEHVASVAADGQKAMLCWAAQHHAQIEMWRTRTNRLIGDLAGPSPALLEAVALAMFRVDEEDPDAKFDTDEQWEKRLSIFDQQPNPREDYLRQAEAALEVVATWR